MTLQVLDIVIVLEELAHKPDYTLVWLFEIIEVDLLGNLEFKVQVAKRAVVCYKIDICSFLPSSPIHFYKNT